jgi:(1->4)-alpha-D-glucan 1-alpha-D-glucosylmutase
MAAVAGNEARALYLVVEKILAEHEQLPEDWPVHGDTGYRFAALVNGLFVHGGNERAVVAAWRAFTGDTLDFDELVYRCKKLIIETSLYSELSWLMHALHRLTAANRRRRDFTRNRLRAALAEVAAAFPVYRTYLRAGEPASAMDRQHIDWAVAAAKRRLGGAEATVVDHLREMLLGEGEATHADPGQRARFLARWQQFTAPVMAKAMEDTAFYRYLPLVSLNDVGADPRSFGLSPAAFHAANQARLKHRPHCLLGSSTHDSKRGEDVRARIDVISEAPELWQESLQRMSGWAELYLAEGDKGAQPSRNDIWLLFQTLVGIWPAQAPDEAEREDIRRRIHAYMLKAVREAKRETNWTCPVQAYEDALARYIDGVLRSGPNPFADELQRLVERIAPAGFRNSLAMLALKMTAPGVPDIYQGCERWNFSLVDPDNRRPVDFARLAEDLQAMQQWQSGGELPASRWDELHRGIADGRLKQYLTWRLLQLRRERESLFRNGSYTQVALEGPAAEHAVAYVRQDGGESLLVVAARLTYTLCEGDESRWSPALWRGTRLLWPDTVRYPENWRHALTGRALPASEDGTDLETLFAGAAGLPFALLLSGATP